MIFLKLLVAHLVADFVFQTKFSIERKKGSHRQIFIHAAIFAGLSILLFIPSLNIGIIAAILFLALAHYSIDWAKTRYLEDNTRGFLLDQGLHITLIGLVTTAMDNNITFLNIVSQTTHFLDSPKILILLVALVLVTSGGSVFVGKIIQPFMTGIESEEKPGIRYAGTYIGILERLLILIFILTNNLTAIGFIFAAKSLIRFPETKEKRHFAEYFLIGTMTSFAYAIIVGLAAQYLMNYVR